LQGLDFFRNKFKSLWKKIYYELAVYEKKEINAANKILNKL
jgi:hypothetical protein